MFHRRRFDIITCMRTKFETHVAHSEGSTSMRYELSDLDKASAFALPRLQDEGESFDDEVRIVRMEPHPDEGVLSVDIFALGRTDLPILAFFESHEIQKQHLINIVTNPSEVVDKRVFHIDVLPGFCELYSYGDGQGSVVFQYEKEAPESPFSHLVLS